MFTFDRFLTLCTTLFLTAAAQQAGVIGVSEVSASEAMASGAVPGRPRIEQEPMQRNLGPAETFSRRIGDLEARARAAFQVDALVLGTMTYRDDRGAAVAPVDLALAWGPMAQPEKAAQLSVSQLNRYYFWRFPPGATLSKQMVSLHSANMHFVSDDPEILAKLKAVKRGDQVSIKGHLVDLAAEDSWRWRTSMARDDIGAGACELILVQSIEIFDPQREAVAVRMKP